MSFIIFNKRNTGNKTLLTNTGQHYSLAGRNLIYNLWLKQGKPVNEGRHITADDILKEQSPELTSCNAELIIDFHPSSRERIGLVSLKDIFIFTHGYAGTAYWSPMMLFLKDVFYEEYEEELSEEKKSEIITLIPWNERKEKIVEFLYLNGDDRGWNWGRNGMTNACFLHEETMEYFKKYL